MSTLECAIAIVTVLHDVVEDTDVTIDDLRAEGFSEADLAGVAALPKRVGERYMDFVGRAALDPIGKVVKIVDLLDNSDSSSIPKQTAKDHERMEKSRLARPVMLVWAEPEV